MKVRATTIPARVVLNKKDDIMTEVQFSINFSPISHDGIEEFEGDMYTVEVRSRENLLDDINAKFDEWIEFAKTNDISIGSAFYLNNLKVQKINDSKIILEQYLNGNPLVINIRGEVETFSINKEKQNLMTTAFTSYQLEKQLTGAATLTWNAMGEVCKEISEEQMCMLILSVKKVVNALISHQQHLEKDILACEDYTQLEAIELEYKSADPRYIG